MGRSQCVILRTIVNKSERYINYNYNDCIRIDDNNLNHNESTCTSIMTFQQGLNYHQEYGQYMLEGLNAQATGLLESQDPPNTWKPRQQIMTRPLFP